VASGPRTATRVSRVPRAQHRSQCATDFGDSGHGAASIGTAFPSCQVHCGRERAAPGERIQNHAPRRQVSQQLDRLGAVPDHVAELGHDEHMRRLPKRAVAGRHDGSRPASAIAGGERSSSMFIEGPGIDATAPTSGPERVDTPHLRTILGISPRYAPSLDVDLQDGPRHSCEQDQLVCRAQMVPRGRACPRLAQVVRKVVTRWLPRVASRRGRAISRRRRNAQPSRGSLIAASLLNTCERISHGLRERIRRAISTAFELPRCAHPCKIANIRSRIASVQSVQAATSPSISEA
jgi:hypothetical protein